MKKLFKSNEEIEVKDVPAPKIEKGSVLVRNFYSVISTGTELSSLSKTKLYEKLNKNNLKKITDIIKQQGVSKGTQKITNKLKEKTFSSIGYSSVGEAIEIGEGVEEIKKGDVVACAGGGYANHAEYVLVPKNLIIKIPSGVDPKNATLTTIASIAMQSVRRLNPTIGETIAVVGLGLIGQITTQILKINGCRVIGIDTNLARTKSEHIDIGLKDFNKEEILNFTQHNGVDGVIIAASTESNLINDSFDICRQKGRVVLLGVCNLNIDRNKMYQKELDFLISTSYGPGRYDTNYEEGGIDYPIGYVRWTEKRNMEAILNLLKEGKLNFNRLINGIYPIKKATQAYQNIKNKKYFSCLLKYNPSKIKERKKYIKKIEFKKGKINIGIIGAGNFVSSTHLPNLQKLNKYYNIYAICDKKEMQAENLAKRYNCQYYTTDYQELLKDKNIDAVLIGTRHNTHAQISIEAIQAQKHIFCEKPMALETNSAEKICNLLEKEKGIIYTVGYNRRYAPLAIKAKEWLENKNGCMIINYIINAGYIPKDHWVLDKNIGGGRIKGEACHMIDFLNWFIGKKIKQITYEFLSSGEFYDQDNLALTLKYEDGSMGNLIYSTIGHQTFSKEHITIFKNQNQIVIDDFKKININGKIQKIKQDKGNLKELEEFAKKIRGEKSLISDEIDAFVTTDLINNLK